MNRLLHVSAIAGLLLASGCGGDSKDSTDTADTVATTVAATTPDTTPDTEAPSTTEAAPSELDARAIVEVLAGDELGGRDNLTDFSTAAQDFLIGEVSQFAQPVFTGEGNEAYLQHFDEGTNILAMVPGGDLASEYIVVGAHYDHLGGVGSTCYTTDDTDEICNGAADNAAGVAAAISAVRAIAAEGTPRRTIVLALWDAEEDGLLGSEAYLADPAFPVEFTVAYVNFDIQGANLSPALANTTIVVGAETGGQELIDMANAAVTESTLDSVLLSVLYGQGRSDHANFVAAGVPSVFFTDANNGCYHSAQDDVLALNFPKLDQQVITATALTRALVATDTPPTFNSTAPATSYDDAVSLLAVVERGLPDVGLLATEAQATYEQYRLDLQAIVDAGPEGFNDEAVGILLVGAVGLVDALTQAPCQTV
ncbi:MAG: M20/M25/M40 family metallo-hydrolase [Actinomycetia bacterium]|nr:M20/M25/M40 family metallo-hydrolase [Actinomycetes bacterium]